jgi:hypothetical protein
MQFLANFFGICLHCSITRWQFVKRAQITFGAVENGKIGHPFGDIRELHAKQMFCNTTVKTKTEINTEVRIILCTRAP